ncbi:MAG: hypothetical protein OWR62_07935 [Sulfobacillus thermotolerans]|nr:hypothetical protein [Sulfobacillus thermotolerans]
MSRILHPDISAWLGKAGHHDFILVTDAGYPEPHAIPCIHLNVVPGIVPFNVVVEAILSSLPAIEAVWIAKETQKEPSWPSLNSMWHNHPIHVIDSHESFKEMAQEKALVTIRTGEWQPYHNCLIEVGSPF